MGVIRLHNMTFYSYHGASRAEQETGRRFEVDVDLHTDLAPAAHSDRLTDALNYSTVYNLVAEVILNRKFNLLETVAATVADEITGNFTVDRVVVRVRKKIPPIPGHLDHIEVEFDSKTDGLQTSE